MTMKNCSVFFGVCFMLFLNTVTAKTNCGSHIRIPSGSTGVLTSPGYPNPYPHSSSCKYRLASYAPSDFITLTFISFHLESHRGCKFDNLTVYNGPSESSDRLALLCGTRIPEPITSRGQHLTLVFKSDMSVQNDGFSLNYSVGCRFQYLETQNNITSPSYPANYPALSSCDYNIFPTTGNQMLLNFLNFDVEESSYCKLDYLALSVIAGTELTRLCGDKYQFKMLLNTSRLMMHFETDRSISRMGFLITYRMSTDCSYENGGCDQICSNIERGKVLCSCNAGYTLNSDGVSCQDVDECQNSPCDDRCINTHGSFTCECSTSGYRLSPNGRTCTDMTCKIRNGGCEQICTSALNAQYHCSCHQGFFLSDDSHNCTDIDECTTTNVKYSHRCEQICVNEPGTYYCDCKEGFKVSANARSCEDINECLSVDHDCEHKCVNLPGGWECGCWEGYDVDPVDANSCIDIEECEMGLVSDACFHCTNTEGSYECICKSGYESNDDNTDCTDINECEDNNGGCDQVCLNSVGQFECSCNPGYRLQSNQSTVCVDINECAPNAGRGPCDHYCENLQGSFDCDCSAGYYLLGDKLTCQDINECEDGKNGGCQQQCNNLPGTKTCTCFDGYKSGSDGICADIDECSSEPCDQDVGAACSNSEGSFLCECPPGYLVVNTTLCVDIDECKVTEHGCPQQCVNLPGTFQCDCFKGFIKVDDKECNDINECMTSPCVHTCRNSVGSYDCECDAGYYLLGDGKNCSDINECEDQLHECAQTCVNEIGYHRCVCRDGFTLNNDNTTCNDVNECVDGISGCSDGCINAEGSFWCYCDTGYQLGADNETCFDINECEINNGGCEHICTNLNSTYKCGCDPGYEFNGTHACSDINECGMLNGNCSQNCANLPGSYECQCEPQYRLDDDNKTCVACPTCVEFQQVRDDVLALKNLSKTVKDLVAANIRLSATVADIQQRLSELEANPLPR